MKKNSALILMLIITVAVNAQVKDSIPRKTKKIITDKFPTMRALDFQYEQFLPTDFTSKLKDKDFEKGRLSNHYRFKVAANIPVYKSKRFFITNSLRYKYEAFEFDNMNDQITNTPFTRNQKEFHYLSGSLNFTYFSSLFKKPIIYNASAIVDGNEKSVQRIKGMVSATMVIKKTERTLMTIGLVGIVDATSIVPIVPSFSYEHRFLNSPWSIDIIMPQRLLFKRQLLENGRLSLGTEFASQGFYLAPNSPYFNGNYEFNQLELKSGLTYEYHISQKLIATFKAGVLHALNTRITERSEPFKDYTLETKQDPTGYFNLGFSYNAF